MTFIYGFCNYQMKYMTVTCLDDTRSHQLHGMPGPHYAISVRKYHSTTTNSIKSTIIFLPWIGTEGALKSLSRDILYTILYCRFLFLPLIKEKKSSNKFY